jgi:hypothetical protein
MASFFGVGADEPVAPGADSAGPALTKEDYGIINKMVIAADSIINSKVVPTRVAEVVEDVKVKTPSKKPTPPVAKKKVTLATTKKKK